MCRREEIMEKVLARIDIDEDTDCWNWTGPTSGEGNGAGRGYGRVSIASATMAVHRVVYTHYFGIIPHKKQVDHKCHNRLCCNPNHLQLLTHKQNQRRKKQNHAN